MVRRCPNCKSKNVVLNPERFWVCADCGVVLRPTYTIPRPKIPKPLQRPQQ